MTDKIRAPWTPEQVAALNAFQLRGGMHPFTCGVDHPGPSPALVARPDGWHCPGTYRAPCDYRQDWAHAFMADPDAWPKFPFSFEERERTGRNAGLVHPQDGPHAPQDGPQRPDAGAETPDGAGGRQTGTEPLARLRRLRDQLAAEHAKAVRADQQPRPDLDHLRVTPHNGIAAGLETAIFFIDHHLRELGEDAAGNLPREPLATRAALVRDQAALAQVRLLIAAHRPRLQLADPILLGRIDAVLRQVGELEAAGGGEG